MLHLSYPSFNDHHPQSRTLFNMSESPLVIDLVAGASSMITSMSLAEQDGDMLDSETQQIVRPTVITPFRAPKVMDLPMVCSTNTCVTFLNLFYFLLWKF